MSLSNTGQMLRMDRYVRRFIVAAATETMVLVHRGTVRKGRSSPSTPRDTGRAVSGGTVRTGTPPTFKAPPRTSGPTIFGEHEVRAAMSKLRLPESAWHGNRVPYVPSLDLGRRFSTTLGRMVGSEQAPNGWLKQTGNDAVAGMRGWIFKEAF